MKTFVSALFVLLLVLAPAQAAREWTNTSNQNLVTPDIPGQNGASAWTIAGWFLHDSRTDEDVFYAAKPKQNKRMQLFHNNTITAYRTRWDIGGVAEIVDVAEADVTLGQWTHYACRYDGTNLEVFINGVSKATNAASGTLDDVQNFNFGAWDDAQATGELDGKLAEWAMWSRALKDNEIHSLAKGLPPSRLARDQLYLPFLGTSSEPEWSGNSRTVSFKGSTTAFDHVPLALPFGDH